MARSATTTPRFEALERLRQISGPDPTDLQAQRESTAVRRIDVPTPAGGRFIVDPETGERRSPLEPRGAREEALANLRSMADQLLNETLANNPLQQLAAPTLRTTGDALREVNVFETDEGESRNAMDIVENIGKGAAIGSLLLPDDAAVDPENPMPAVQIASAFIGAGAEGALADFGILRGLGMVRASAQARGAKNIASSADKALRVFGQGEKLSRFRQLLGGAALAGTGEAALRALTLDDPIEIIKGAGLVSVGGAALGGAVASVGAGVRAARATPRALRSFGEEFAEKAAPEIQETFARGGSVDEASEAISQAVERSQVEFDLAAKEGVGEQGLRPRTEYIERAERAFRRIREMEAIERAPSIQEGRPFLRSSAGRTQDARIEALHDPANERTIGERFRESLDAGRQSFRDAFVYEARLQDLPSTTGHPELSAADDVRVLKHGVQRADRIAAEDVSSVIDPIRKLAKEDLTPAWRMFERVVVLRDLAETAERGLDLPLQLTLDDVQRELARLESGAPKPVLEAAQKHRQLVSGWREEMIRRGELEVGDGYENYFPHQIVEDLATSEARITGSGDTEIIRNAYPTSSAIQRGGLKEPSRPYTRRREGSARKISTDYIDVMHRAGRRFHADNIIKDFLDDVGEGPLRLRRKDLSQDELQDLIRRGEFIRNGRRWSSFNPKGRAYYRTNAVDDAAFTTLRDKLQDEVGIDIADMPELRTVLAVGKPKEYILPKDLAERLDQFYQPDPLELPGTATFKRLTQRWKRNAIFWGLSRFAVFQILGDGTNLMRSNPAAFAQIRNGKIDSPLFRALRVQFARYGTPMMSREQLVGQMGGGVGGLALNEVLAEEDPSTLSRVSSFLAGAGLGYLVGTRRVAGSAEPRQGLRAIYEEADRTAAINSGFVFSEEELAKRLLGTKSASLPSRRTSGWRRSIDTAETLLTGKATGDSFAPFEIPARMLEVFQRERENTMRLASYMQQVEQGVSPRIAAKRAREALVDYGKFSEFENKFIRGFALPFYSFHRHNIPNWIKAAMKKDVGGKPTAALAAVTALAAADLSTQLWNETFFPEVERSLPKWQREQFHIITGNPITRTPYKDKDGNALVVGWEMPYEQALEFFGLARPGQIYSELFGLGGLQNLDISLVERAKRSAKDVALLKDGPGALAKNLLNPFLKAPIEIAANKDFFFDAPIVPQRYFQESVLETPEARGEIYRHVAESFFRQYREFKRLGRQVKSERFDPLTSAVGLGLPVQRTDLNRNLQGWLHEQISEAEKLEIAADARWKSEIDDVLMDREDFAKPEEGELQTVVERLNEVRGLKPTDIEQAKRYYMSRGGKGSLARRWESLSSENKARVFNQLPEWGQTALVNYVNFGEAWLEQTELGGGAGGAVDPVAPGGGRGGSVPGIN